MRNIFILIISLAWNLVAIQAQPAEKNLKLSGRVLDQSGKPVEGARLIVDNVQQKNVSGAEGQFRIKVPASASKIGVYFAANVIGEVSIHAENFITLVVPDSIHERIDAQLPKRNSARDFSHYTNMYDLIRSELPNVQVNGTSINIRGASSFAMDTQPLIVVDGVIIDNLGSISPNDVAAVDVLKGPDASMYGVQGANGVILIKLKKN